MVDAGMKRHGGLRVAVCSVLAFLIIPGCGDSDGMENVTIKGHDFVLKLSADDATRDRGLGGVAELAEDGGMLFAFPDVKMRAFWMKDCLIDIDIIFLGTTGRITAMHRMKAVPLQAEDESTLAYEARLRANDYGSGFPAQFVVELKSGWLDRLDLQVDDRIEIDTSRLAELAAEEKPES